MNPRLVGGALAAIAAFANRVKRATAGPIAYSFESAVGTTYVNRGIPQYTDDTDPMAMNTLGVTMPLGDGTLSAGGTALFALANFHAQPGTAAELDPTIAYARTKGNTTITVAYTAGLFPDHDDATPIDGSHELSLVTTYQTPWFTPMAGVFVEGVRQRGAYVMLGASRDLHASCITITPAVSAGGAAYLNYGGGDMAVGPHLNDVTVGLAAKIDLPGGTYAAFRASYAYRGTPDDAITDDDDGHATFAERSTLVGVLALGIAR